MSLNGWVPRDFLAGGLGEAGHRWVPSKSSKKGTGFAQPMAAHSGRLHPVRQPVTPLSPDDAPRLVQVYVDHYIKVEEVPALNGKGLSRFAIGGTIARSSERGFRASMGDGPARGSPAAPITRK